MYDAIIVGSRCAGASTARLLAQKGRRVLMVDRAHFPSDTVSTHCVTIGGVIQLRRWGLLDRVLATIEGEAGRFAATSDDKLRYFKDAVAAASGETVAAANKRLVVWMRFAMPEPRFFAPRTSPELYRKPYGTRCELVGHAGYHKD